MGISQSALCRRSGIALSPAEADSGSAASGSMAWGFLLQGRRRRRRRRRGGDGSGGDRENKSWLLAEADSQSVHSSFRLSFGSQAEEEMEAPPTAAATVLILVSTDDEGEAEAGRRRELDGASADLRQLWRRLDSLERSIAPAAGGLVRFSYAQLRSATQDFCRGKELGRGELSRVYKGRLGHRMQRQVVAIKRVDGPERESAKAFCRELLIASSLCSSPNVVLLVGYCIDGEGLFLVYTYISGGSLDRRLHQNEKRGKVLPWKVRYKVAVGVAQAVEYLHFGTDKCVVHRDIKPSNILLSSKRSPMLCDFGLATWTHGPSLPFLCKTVKGTFGYLAPEYFQNGKLSDKTDVYAFGVVLLELITGRKALDQSRPQGDENLVMWAKPLLPQGEDVMEKLIDPRLATDSYRRNEMCRMVRAAGACLRCEDSMRPSIDQVLAMLLGEENPCTEWSLFNAHSCIVGYGGSQVKRDMGGHLALAMLGVSDNEEGDSYGR